MLRDQVYFISFHFKNFANKTCIFINLEKNYLSLLTKHQHSSYSWIYMDWWVTYDTTKYNVWDKVIIVLFKYFIRKWAKIFISLFGKQMKK